MSGPTELCRRCAGTGWRPTDDDDLERCPCTPRPHLPFEVARQFHETYERLAPTFDYQTRPESAVPWAFVPETNRQLMEAVVAEVVGPLIVDALAVRDAEYAALVAAAQTVSKEECRIVTSWTDAQCTTHHTIWPCPIEVLRQTLAPFEVEP